MDERILIGIGIVLIVIGIVGAIVSGPVSLDSQSAVTMGDQAAAKSLRLRADTLQYGGAGLAGVGLVLMTAGLVKGQLATASRF